MEKICKIRQFVILVGLLLIRASVLSQNFYGDCIVYYNMDSTKIASEARPIFEEYDILDIDTRSITIPDTLYNIFKETLCIPNILIKERGLFRMIKRSIKKSLSDGTILKPDNSGFFVNLIVKQSAQDDTYRIKIVPTSNYYMYDALFLPRRYLTYNIIGCFYCDTILCIVQSCCNGEKIDGSCFWEATGTHQEIKIYQHELEYIMDYYGPEFEYYVKKCN